MDKEEREERIKRLDAFATAAMKSIISNQVQYDKVRNESCLANEQIYSAIARESYKYAAHMARESDVRK